MRSVVADFMKEEKRNRIIMMKSAPTNAPATVTAGDHSPVNFPPKSPALNNKKATPREAPEEIPKTEGPARGLWKRVCIMSPATANRAPQHAAPIAMGIRVSKTMVLTKGETALRLIRAVQISLTGMATAPIIKSDRNNITTDRIPKRNNLLFKFSEIMKWRYRILRKYDLIVLQ